MISKTEAKKKFFLQDNHLVKLPRNIVMDKYDQKTQWFSYHDIVEAAIKKFGSIEEFMKEKEPRGKKFSKHLNGIERELKSNECMLQMDREIELKDEIKEYDPTFNDWSIYYDKDVQSYIKKGHKSKYCKDDIIEILKEKVFLTKTKYQSILQKKPKMMKDQSYVNSCKEAAVVEYIKGGGDVNFIPMGLINLNANMLKI